MRPVNSKQIFKDHKDLEEPNYQTEFGENIMPEIGLIGLAIPAGVGMASVAVNPVAPAAVVALEAELHHRDGEV